MRLGRRFLLEAGPPEGVRRFVSELPITLSLDGEKPQSWVTVTRTGTFHDKRYGEFEITRAMLLQMVENFDKGTYGQEILFDVAHQHTNGAAATVMKLAVEGNKLRALLEWTPYGVDAVKNRGFRYLSAEYHDNWVDNERRMPHGAVLLGAGLTVRPVVKNLEPIELSEPDGAPPTLLHPELASTLLSEIHAMWKDLIKRLSEKLKSVKLAEQVVEQLVATAEKTLGSVTDKAVAETFITSFEATGIKLAEAIGDKSVTLNIQAPNLGAPGMSEAQVKQLMEDMRKAQEADAKKLTETTAARVKLLTDTIGAAEGLDDALKKELGEGVKDLVTAEMSEDQIKRLAATQIASGNKIVAARQLARMGWDPNVRGTPHIDVDTSNEVKTLQEQFDKRLEKMPAHKRYALSQGEPITGNKALVEAALAKFDAENGPRLHAEYKRLKQLAAGDSLVSDVAIPVSYERTVLRESMYQMTGLALCDVGTAGFAAVVQLPYSYRDTTAAGVSSTRVYEGGAIARAAVKQALEEMRPMPQKLAFEVSDELRYLAGNGQISFDILAENANNAVRIVGEDGERLIYNEYLNAADQYATAAIVNENLELQADDAKKVFILAQWPVLHPKKVYDLQGTQVGSTLYPITVTYDAVARSEYDGTGTQANGIYYVLSYNLGEIYLVDELGAIQIPANGTAYTISYTYSTNVYKFDTDEGADELDVHWDKFLYRFGVRRTTIEDRNYMASMGTMSGSLRDSVGQAKQFGANFKREGTNLDATGNVGRIKDVPTWRSYAPGLNAGDQRVVIGERGTVRFRMCKAWTLGALQDQRDSNGRFTGKKEAYGDQFVIVHTPTQLKAALTSMVIYSAAARVARVAP